MNIFQEIQDQVQQAFPNLFGSEVELSKITINETPKEFIGDITLVVFPLLKLTKKNPEESAKTIGEFLVNNNTNVTAYNIIKGFLNLSIRDTYWINSVINPSNNIQHPSSETVLIEYSSPNTNKPLHLGHVRNNVLGYALAGIYKANGYKVIKANLINDRGIHICKSMLAWQKFGNGETPESSGLKGDKLVGKYYVEFDKQYKREIEALIAEGKTKEEAEKQAPLLGEAQEMLLKWEKGDEAVVKLWETMNSWVYAGFDITYKNLGVDFDKFYYESNTYLLGKDIIEEGLKNNVFFKKEDGSVWIDLTADGLDQKLVLRADGTSVYITQDLGTADLKYNDFKMDKSIYVVGNEQDYHFKVLKLILQKLGKPYADGIHHFSYGMVDLPSGKMKSREGTVVDADDLIEDMIASAKEQTEALGKIDEFTDTEKEALFRTIGLGALKFFLLRVDPKKRILFDPKESIDLHGYTGPFVQYTYARTRSILRKSQESGSRKHDLSSSYQLHPSEKELIKVLYHYNIMLNDACKEMNPAKLIDYSYEVAKTYNKFYNDCSILAAEKENEKNFRIQLTEQTGNCIKQIFAIVGIDVPERM
ncbi:MAG TPA: arginine--tRNA ligase [Chitinophagales bacterium]|nr:arginine--tRNA ligase [Chitinophagales bacterium]